MSDYEADRRSLMETAVITGIRCELNTSSPLMPSHELSNLLGEEFCEQLRNEAYAYKSHLKGGGK